MPEATRSADAGDSGQKDRSLEDRHRRNWNVQRRNLYESISVAVPLVLVIAVGIWLAPNFLSATNVSNVLNNASLLAIVGYGMTFAITIRGIDLSVGSAQALIATITGISVNAFGIVPGVLIALLVGAATGTLNGLLATSFRIPAFVATLATMTAFRGAALLITDGASVYVTVPLFERLATTTFLGLQMQTIVAIILGILAWFLLRKTAFGKHMTAVGGRPEAASETGISITRVTILVYAITGICVAISAVLLASRLGMVNGTLASGLELQVIAVVVLGGTSMAGGKANIVGTGIAAVLLATVNSLLNLMNVPSYWQYVAVGGILVVALGIDGLRRMHRRRQLAAAPIREADPNGRRLSRKGIA